jgi:hypothetical protein
LLPCIAGAQPQYYSSNENDTIVIENVNCSWDEPRLRDCSYFNYTLPHGDPKCGKAGVRCKVIKNINFATANNYVLITWEYNNTLHQPSLFDVRCNGQLRHYKNITSGSSGTFRVSYSVGDLLQNASYDCCVSARYAQTSSTTITTEIRCASFRSEDLLTPTDTISTFNIISDTDMTATVTVVGAVLGCIIFILLVLLAVCGGALFHLLRSRTSGAVNKR